jgi:hypothetical protein
LKCKVCNREVNTKGDYCELHEKAYKNITRKYDEWKKALDISWESYLNEIIKNPLTGVWAKEVAQQLLFKERSNS